MPSPERVELFATSLRPPFFTPKLFGSRLPAKQFLFTWISVLIGVDKKGAQRSQITFFQLLHNA